MRVLFSFIAIILLSACVSQKKIDKAVSAAMSKYEKNRYSWYSPFNETTDWFAKDDDMNNYFIHTGPKTYPVQNGPVEQFILDSATLNQYTDDDGILGHYLSDDDTLFYFCPAALQGNIPADLALYGGIRLAFVNGILYTGSCKTVGEFVIGESACGPMKPEYLVYERKPTDTCNLKFIIFKKDDELLQQIAKKYNVKL
jgi:hypothetical protein